MTDSRWNTPEQPTQADVDALKQVIYEGLIRVEPILSLLHHRGLVDSTQNRSDVTEALHCTRKMLAELKPVVKP